MKLFVLCLAFLLFSLTVHANAQSNTPVAALSVQDKHHILHDTFVVSRTVNAISNSVKQEFERRHHGMPLRMADPGQKFQGSDVRNGLPMTRLVFYAVGRDMCVLHYEYGGWGPRTITEVFRLSGSNATLTYTDSGGQIYSNLTDLQWSVWAGASL